MRQTALSLLATTFLALPVCGAQNSSPEFREVFEVLRTNLPGTSEAELNRAAVEGLLSELRGQAKLVGQGTSATNPALSRFDVVDDGVAVATLRQIEGDVAARLLAAWKAAAGTNRLKGLVVDLRFATGDDYEAMVALADLMLGKPQPLLDWGAGMVNSKSESREIAVPLAVLVNRETHGAPEALAAVLRQAGVCLVLGNPTAGHAMVAKDFELNSGQKLRIGTAPVKLADGSTIPAGGLKPDILVNVSVEQDRAFQLAPYGTNKPTAMTSTNSASATATNRPPRRTRLSEADLVRERRAENGGDASQASREAPQEKPVIRDPVLARAVDLLKGLAVVRGGRN